MKSLHDGPVRGEVRARLARIRPGTLPKWGRMSASQMTCHLVTWMEMALGERPIAERRLFVRFPIIKQFAVYLMPIPKGLPTARELLSRSPDASLETDRAAFEAALDRFGAHDAAAPWPPHPAFGPLSRRAWGVLAFRHTDHHLRQFGV